MGIWPRPRCTTMSTFITQVTTWFLRGDSYKGVVSEPQWSSNPPPVATALNRHGLKPVTPAAGTDGMAQGHWNECPPHPPWALAAV